MKVKKKKEQNEKEIILRGIYVWIENMRHQTKRQ
jgi:hypothetical protein